jgi:hypothetical protein
MRVRRTVRSVAVAAKDQQVEDLLRRTADFLKSCEPSLGKSKSKFSNKYERWSEIIEKEKRAFR